MGRMHGTGKAASALPYKRRPAKLNNLTAENVCDTIEKLAKKGTHHSHPSI
jgi:Ribosomal S13/S15 N-terminal domain